MNLKEQIEIQRLLKAGYLSQPKKRDASPETIKRPPKPKRRKPPVDRYEH